MAGSQTVPNQEKEAIEVGADNADTYLISMGSCKKNVNPVLQQLIYVFLALTHRYAICQSRSSL